MRGLSAGALHIPSGIITGFGLAYVFSRSWLLITGTFGLYGVCVTMHAIYNLMITAEHGAWRAVGYVFPAALISMLFILRIVSARTGLPERLNGVRAVPENDIFDDEDV